MSRTSSRSFPVVFRLQGVPKQDPFYEELFERMGD